jgi:hypothetical protein
MVVPILSVVPVLVSALAPGPALAFPPGLPVLPGLNGPQAVTQQSRLPALDDNLRRLERVPGAPLWSTWVRRDERVSFTRHSVVLADRAYRDEEASAEERACADLVLALVEGHSARPFLRSRIAESTGVERRAAVLALGETGVGIEAQLEQLIDEPDVGDCAVLALLRLSQDATDQVVLALVQRGDHPLSRIAENLSVFDDVPEKSIPTAAGALLLNLRWHAARLFGLVDGQVWRVVVNERLLEDRSFVREAVLRSAGNLGHPSVTDHVLELLLEGDSSASLRAAVACMPRELSTIVQLEHQPEGAGGFWKPSGMADWLVLLDEIEAKYLELDTIDLLVTAREVPELRFRATALLSRARAMGSGGALFGEELEQASDPDRMWACEAMGNTGEKRWLAVLEPMRESANADVRAAARIAQVRLGSERARDEVADLLEGEDAELRAALIRAMCHNVRDSRTADWLDRLLREADGAEAVTIATALAAHGRLEARSRLRDLLREEPPRGRRGAAIVRALATNPSREDIELLAGLFPRADDRPMNVALAVALIEAGSIEVLPLVRSAIWDEGWNVSILAAGILAERSSVATLVDELSQPPSQATSEDIRRLGFALGEWGGIQEVASLARSMRYNSGHPAVQGALLGALSQRTR